MKLRNDNTILINDITNTIEKEVKEITNSNNNSDSDNETGQGQPGCVQQ